MEVQLCREMGWTLKELYETDEEFVWATATILGYEGEKMRRDMARSKTPPNRRPL